MRTLLTLAAAAAILPSAASAQAAPNGPCLQSQFGTALNLGDDQTSPLLPLGFSFPGPAGAVTAITVSSNGFVWLGANGDSGCCHGDVNKFVSQMARIAPLWMDLDPSLGGQVWFGTQPASGPLPASAIVTWAAVPEYGSLNLVTVQLQLFADGSFSMYWDPGTTVQSHAALVGVTQGGGATPNFFDISQTATSPFDSGTNATAYEDFAFGFDLTASVYTFVPNGQGGYSVTSKSCPFASTRRFGIGCPKPVTTYELFGSSNPIDLSNTALEFTPTGTGGYVITPATTFFTGYTGFQVFGDDDSHGPFALPFPFPYPGGSTTAIDICSNGFVWLQAGNINSRCCLGDPTAFVNDPPSIAALWMDLNPPAANPGDGVYFDVVGTTEAHITWSNVPEFPNIGANTCQITLRANGSFRLAWGAVANLQHDCVVGLSEGNGIDPGSIDLSAGVFATGSGGNPLRLDAQPGSRPSLGTTFTMDIDQIATGSLLGLMVFGTTSFPNGFDLTPIGMPECSLYAALGSLQSFPLTGSPSSFSFVVPNAPTLVGVLLQAQAATITPGANALGVYASNGLELTLGF